MNSNKWLYFRTVTGKSSDDGVKDTALIQNTSVCFPADSIIDISPLNATTLSIEFEPVKNIMGSRGKESTAFGATTTITSNDSVELTLKATGTHKEVINRIVDAINGSKGSSLIVVADDLSGKETYIEGISACGTIYTPKTNQGFGKHEMSCYVKPTAASADNDVVAQLPFYLPKKAIILEAAMYPLKLATNSKGLLALEYHTASLAADAPSAGTEILGFDALTVGETARNQVKTITLNATLATNNGVEVKVNGTLYTQGWSTNEAGTMNAIAGTLNALPEMGVAASDVGGVGFLNTLTFTAANDGDNIDISDITIGAVTGVGTSTDTSAPTPTLATATSAHTTYYNGTRPGLDLDISTSAAAIGLHSSNMIPISNLNNYTYLHVCAKEDMSTMSGNPRVQVYVKWWGGPAVAIA